jgi:hypothetical protein
MLLIERSAERYPAITAVMIEFLKHSVDKYFPPMKEYMGRGVACGMGVLINKGVIRSLMPIYKCPSTETATKEYMQALFSEFLVEGGGTVPPLPTSPSMHATPDMAPTTPKTEDVSDAEEMDVKRRSSTPQRQHSLTVIKDDDDVDAYLYGDPQENDEPMDDISDDEMSPEEEQEESEEKDVEFESEDESAKELESHQSYWIFGDALKVFKDPSTDDDAAKKSLKEILNVFTRMTFHIRNIMVANLLHPEDDVFDLVMATFWGDCNTDAARAKMVQLIGAIAQFKKNKTKRHVVGMRWWSFMAK